LKSERPVKKTPKAGTGVLNEEVNFFDKQDFIALMNKSRYN
jgi:hypothetical protein